MYKISILVLLFFQVSTSQFLLEDWNLFTSFNNPIQAVNDSEGSIWVATLGGIYRYNPNDSTYKTWNKIDGLSDLAYTSIAYLPDQNIIAAGSVFGSIDLINLDNENILNVNDLKSASGAGTLINHLNYHNGDLFVCSGIGLSQFRPKKGASPREQIFVDTYQTANLINSVIKDNDIYILIRNDGVYKNSLNNVLSDPTNWEKQDLYTIPTIDLDTMVVFNDEFYFHTKQAVWKLESDTAKIILEKDVYDFQALFEHDDELYALSFFAQFNLTNGNVIANFNDEYYDAFSYQYENESAIYWLSKETGLANVNEDFVNISPNSTGSNSVFDIDVSGEQIWATTGSRGTMYYDGKEWQYFNRRLKDIWDRNISGNGHRKVFIASEEKVYVGQKGTGLYEFEKVNNDSIAIRIFNDTNSVYRGITEIPDDWQPGDEVSIFNEVGGIDGDNNGLLWTVNNGINLPGPTLVAYNGSDFYSFADYPLNTCQGQISRSYFHIEIDAEGTKWLGTDPDQTQIRNGLFLYNENGTLEDDSDDLCMVVRTSSISELPDNSITAIKSDKNGWVWVGTPRGVVYFLNPGAIRFSDDPDDLIPVTSQIFDSFNVVDIGVDAVNNKWIVTNEAITVFDPEGTEVIATISSDNSPLPESGLTSIKIEEESGTVYVGTQSGLFSTKTLFSKPLESFDINIYPQPFDPNKDEILRFNGLARDSELRILSPDGELVKVLRASGRETIWDGRKENGKFVNSGVYLVVAGSEAGGSRSVGKFAVVRK